MPTHTLDELRQSDAGQRMHDMAANRAEILSTAGNMMGMVQQAEEHLHSIQVDWASQWAEIGLAYDEGGDRVEFVTNLKDRMGYDEALLGPPLKQKDPEKLADEIASVLLRREQDFTDAVVNVGRDDFLGDPLDNTHRNATLVSVVAAGAYSAMRELFLSLGPEVSCRNVHHYRTMIRSFRSLCYLTRLSHENLRGVEERINHLETLRDKYDATIFTLRRQLQDFHRQAGTVGRGADGAYQTFAPATTSPASHGLGHGGSATSACRAKSTVIIVQVENINHLRGRQQQLYDAAGSVSKNIVTTLANAFDLRRTNYTESGNTTRAAPASYMFVGDEAFQAIAFATELHVELNRSNDWPPPLMQMTKFGGSDTWRGLRVRVGIHFGVVSEMDVPEATAVMHAEGVQVEKAMRIAALGCAGDTVVSAKLWEQYQQELTQNVVPTNRRYQSLRAMKTMELLCGKRRGFKKGEVCIRAWHAALTERADSPPFDTDFEVISFFGLEAGTRGDAADDDPPTAEELLYAKETELAVVQQELDTLRLAVMKRDSDVADVNARLMSSLQQFRKRTQNKLFFQECLNTSLEEQLLAAHDTLSCCAYVPMQQDKASAAAVEGGGPTVGDGGEVLQEEQPTGEGGLLHARSSIGGAPHPFAPPPPTPLSLVDLEESRRKRFNEWADGELKERAVVADDGTSSAAGTSACMGSPRIRGATKHKNVSLWRQLNSLVQDASVKVVPAPSTSAFSGGGGGGGGGGSKGDATVSSQGLRRIHSSIKHGSVPHLARFHRVLRVFSALTRRFIASEELTNDSDNQAITEEQFIFLFLKLMHPEGVAGNQREYMQLMAHAAVDNETLEAASQDDDGKMIRSGAGHLARIFMWLKQFKRKAVMDANTAKKLAQDEAAAAAKDVKRRAPAAGGGTAAGAGKAPGGSSLLSATLQNGSTGPAASTKKKTPTPSPSTSPRTASMDLGTLQQPVSPTESAAEVLRLKDEVSFLKAELSKTKAAQHASLAAAKLTRAKTDDSRMNGAGGRGSGAAATAATVSPTTQSLVDEAMAAISSGTELHQPVFPPLDGCGTISPPPATSPASQPLQGDPSVESIGGGGGAIDSFTAMFKPRGSVPQRGDRPDEDLAGSVGGPQVGRRPSDDDDEGRRLERHATRGPLQSETHQNGQPTGSGNRSIWQSSARTSPTRGGELRGDSALGGPKSPPSPMRASTSVGSCRPKQHVFQAQGTGMGIGMISGTGLGVGDRAAALAAARAHRGAPFSADRTLQIGGSQLNQAPRSGGSGSDAFIASPSVAGLPGADQQSAVHPSTTTSGDHPHRAAAARTPGPVLHPLKNAPGGVGQAGLIAAVRAMTPATNATHLQQPSPQGLPVMVGHSSVGAPETVSAVEGRRVAAPTGMSAPVPQPGTQNKLYFALNARDVQRQLDADTEERLELERQQHRIQEQLVQLRQLQAENHALMVASNRPDASTPGQGKRQGTPGASKTLPLGVTRLSGPTSLALPGGVVPPQRQPPKQQSQGPSMVVGSLGTGKRGTDTHPTQPPLHVGAEGQADEHTIITVPSAQQQRGQLLSNIVAQHRVGR